MRRSTLSKHTVMRLLRGTISLLVACMVLLGTMAFALAEEVREADLKIIVEDIKSLEFRATKVEIPNLDDPAMKKLMGYMTMSVTVKGNEVFKGSCDKLPEPIFDWVTFPANRFIVIDVTIEFDKWADNTVQGIPFEMIWHFQTQDERMHEMTVNKTGDFYTNGNVNPGDVLKYQIMVMTSEYDDYTEPTVFNPNETTNPNGNNGGNTTNDGNNPPPYDTTVKTGGVLQQTFTEHLDLVLLAVGLVVIGCIVLILFAPSKPKKE